MAGGSPHVVFTSWPQPGIKHQNQKKKKSGHQNHGLWMMCDAEKHRLHILDGVHALDANLDKVCADLLNNFSFILLILFAILPD